MHHFANFAIFAKYKTLRLKNNRSIIRKTEPRGKFIILLKVSKEYTFCISLSENSLENEISLKIQNTSIPIVLHIRITFNHNEKKQPLKIMKTLDFSGSFHFQKSRPIAYFLVNGHWIFFEIRKTINLIFTIRLTFS